MAVAIFMTFPHLVVMLHAALAANVA